MKQSVKHKNKLLSKFFSTGDLKEYEPPIPGASAQGVLSLDQVALVEMKLTKSIEGLPWQVLNLQ